MSSYLHIIGVISCLILTKTSLGQNDFGLWTGVEVNSSITKDIKIGLEGQARFDNNASKMKETYCSPSIKWDILKMLRVGFNYRLSNIPYNSTSTNRINTHRYTFDLDLRNLMNLREKKSDFDLSLRIRGTREYEALKRTQSYLRFRLKADYNIPKTKVTPFLAVELFYHFNDQITYSFNEVTATHGANKLRTIVGADIPIDKKKRHVINAFGMYQGQFSENKNAFILGIGYSFDFDLKKKKK